MIATARPMSAPSIRLYFFSFLPVLPYLHKRYTCSAVSARFLFAFSFFMASSSVVMLRKTGKNASIPCSLHSLASRSTDPANAITVFPYFLASFATPIGAFPIAVCLSSLPSPVTTRSASLIYSSSCVSSSTILIPDSSTALVNVKNANPSPPAAPVPAFLHLLSEIFLLPVPHNMPAICPSA